MPGAPLVCPPWPAPWRLDGGAGRAAAVGARAARQKRCLGAHCQAACPVCGVLGMVQCRASLLHKQHKQSATPCLGAPTKPRMRFLCAVSLMLWGQQRRASYVHKQHKQVDPHKPAKNSVRLPKHNFDIHTAMHTDLAEVLSVSGRTHHLRDHREAWSPWLSCAFGRCRGICL